MRRLERSSAALALAACSALGCGAGAPPSPVAEPVQDAPLEPFAVEPDPGPPSAGAVGAMRIQDLAGLRRATGSPVVTAVVRRHDDRLQLFVPPSLHPLLSESRPADVFWVATGGLLGPPEVAEVLSAEVRSVDDVVRAARASNELVTEVPGGRFAIGLERGPGCLAFVAEGGESRLLCDGRDAEARADLVELAEELARRTHPEGSVVAELSGPALRGALGARLTAAKVVGARTFAEIVTMEVPTLAPALVPLSPILVTEAIAILDDLDYARARIGWGRSHTDVELAIRFAGATSGLAAATADVAASSTGAAPLYWQMPGDAHTTLFSAVPDTQRLEALRSEAASRIAASAELLDPMLRRLLVESVVPRQRFAYAAGAASVSLPEGWHVYGERDVPSFNADAVRLEVTARFGWHLFAVDEPIDRYLPYLDRAFEAYRAGPLRDLVYDTFVGLCEGLPAITRREVKTARLPKGTIAYEMVVPSSMLEKCLHRGGPVTPAQPIRGIILVVPDERRTWIGLSLEPEDLERRVAAAIARDGSRGGLAEIADLAPLREGKAILGGHLTPLGLAMAQSNFESFQRGLYSGKEAVREAQRSPSGGLTPIPYALHAQGGESPTLELRFRVPDTSPP